MKYIKTIGNKLGVDKAIAYSSGARIIQAFTGVGSIFFISTFLTGIEQGFYYTFGSILAIQVFFELGLTGIMTQYVAHEVSHLTLDYNNEYQGENKYKSRLASLIRFCIKWYSILALLVFVFILMIGYIYFTKYGEDQGETVSWKFPWLIICIATAIKFFQSPFTNILFGLGFVKEISKISFWQQIIIPAVSWFGLIVGLKLYVLGLASLITIIIWFYFIKKQNLLPVIINLLKIKIDEKVEYKEEIFPYQWKIALSWISGYFIFQLFNPVLFATEGAVIAGQMGMTLTALNSIQVLSLSWLNTKIPLYSKYIALKEYSQLDSIFKKTLKQMTSICTLLLITFILFIIFLDISDIRIGNSNLSNRFLSIYPTILLIIAILSDQFVNSWATYLRCHKKEPYLALSITMGILCGLSTIYLGKLYGLYGIVIGYVLLKIFIALPWANIIYKKKKKMWHEKQ